MARTNPVSIRLDCFQSGMFVLYGCSRVFARREVCTGVAMLPARNSRQPQSRVQRVSSSSSERPSMRAYSSRSLQNRCLAVSVVVSCIRHLWLMLRGGV